MTHLAYLVVAWVFIIGIYGIVSSHNFVHMILCLAVVQSSTYILLLEIGYRVQGTAPIFKDIPVGEKTVDPVVQALTLTDIVVGVTVTALLLALALQGHKRSGSLDPEDLKPMSG